MGMIQGLAVVVQGLMIVVDASIIVAHLVEIGSGGRSLRFAFVIQVFAQLVFIAPQILAVHRPLLPVRFRFCKSP